MCPVRMFPLFPLILLIYKAPLAEVPHREYGIKYSSVVVDFKTVVVSCLPSASTPVHLPFFFLWMWIFLTAFRACDV
jgi:hypothetical protein